MINIGVVCHSKKLAEELINFVKIFSDENTKLYNLYTEDTLGSTYEVIKKNILKIGNKAPILIFTDLGSSIENVKDVILDLKDYEIKLANAPLLEGLITATTGCEKDTTLPELALLVAESRYLDKNV